MNCLWESGGRKPDCIGYTQLRLKYKYRISDRKKLKIILSTSFILQVKTGNQGGRMICPKSHRKAIKGPKQMLFK